MGYKLNRQTSLREVFLSLDLPWPNNTDILINGVSSINNYLNGSLSFCNKKTEVPFDAILITNQNIDVKSKIFSDSPRATFIQVLEWLYNNIGFDLYNSKPDIHPSASIGSNVVIEDGCVIGEKVVIEPNVVIHKGTLIGNNTIIRSCTSIGSDGFGFERLQDGSIVKFPHLGKVVIGRDVEIGSCTSISRGTLSDTVIKDNVKISNQVHIAHNVEIHNGAMLAASVEVSGSVIIGSNAWVSPNACINHKIRIGNNTLIGLGAVVIRDVADDIVVVGNPAKELKNYR